MRPLTVVICFAAPACLAAWFAPQLWAASTETAPATSYALSAAEHPELPTGPTRDAFRQPGNGPTPTRKGVFAREARLTLQKDLEEQRRDAAAARFQQADSNGDGTLSFEEALSADMLRRPGRVPVGPTPTRGGPGGPGGQFQDRVRGQGFAASQGDGRRAQARTPQGFRGAPREQVLDSWELLQELEVLSKDSGGR